MSSDHLRDQLEDLFSGTGIPEPSGEPPEDSGETPLEEPAPDIPRARPRRATEFATPPLKEDLESLEPPRPSGRLRGWMARFQSSLRAKLILAFSIVAILPLIAVSIWGFYTLRSTIQSNTQDNLELLATLQENQVEQWAESQVQAFRSLAREQTLERQNRVLLRTDPGEAEYATAELAIVARLRTFLVQYEFEEVFLLDAQGQVILSTDTVHEGESEAGKPFFEKGLQDSYGATAGYITRWEKICLVVAEPVRYITGESLGVMIGYIKTDPLNALVQEGFGLGETGETYLIDSEGLLITSLRRSEKTSPGAHIRQSEGIKRVLAGQSGRGSYDNYAGRPVLGVYRWLPDVSLGLLTEQEVQETNRPVWTALVGVALVAVLAAVSTIGLAGYIASRLARPIVEMTDSARQMVAGDLNQSVRVTRIDEVGALGRAFNHMVRRLRLTVSMLEEKVAERTSLLQDANYRLERRAVQLEVSAQVSRVAASILDPKEMMQSTVDLIRSEFNLYHVAIFLLDQEGEWAVVQAATGDVGRKMMAQPYRLPLDGDSIVSWVCNQRQARITLNADQDATYFDNPLLPKSLSRITLPLYVGDHMMGALDVQSIREAAFDDDDLRTLQGMADQVAIALENARRFAETRRGERRQRLAASISERMQQATNLDEVMALTIEDLGNMFDLTRATICLGTERELLRPAQMSGNGPEPETGAEPEETLDESKSRDTE